MATDNPSQAVADPVTKTVTLPLAEYRELICARGGMMCWRMNPKPGDQEAHIYERSIEVANWAGDELRFIEKINGRQTGRFVTIPPDMLFELWPLILKNVRTLSVRLAQPP